MCDIHVHTIWMACQSIAGLERGVKTGLRELMLAMALWLFNMTRLGI